MTTRPLAATHTVPSAMPDLPHLPRHIQLRVAVSGCLRLLEPRHNPVPGEARAGTRSTPWAPPFDIRGRRVLAVGADVEPPTLVNDVTIPVAPPLRELALVSNPTDIGICLRLNLHQPT